MNDSLKKAVLTGIQTEIYKKMNEISAEMDTIREQNYFTASLGNSRQNQVDYRRAKVVEHERKIESLIADLRELSNVYWKLSFGDLELTGKGDK
jgi:hypothetical protein